jgi:hypothetical protein
MGWFTNYEVEFQEDIDWDDQIVKTCLKDFNVQYLYLRDMGKPRLVLCIYSQNHIEEVLLALNSIYQSDICYRVYDSNKEWMMFNHSI